MIVPGDVLVTDIDCKNHAVRVVGFDKCVEYCRVDGNALRKDNDCSNCRLPEKREQTKLM